MKRCIAFITCLACGFSSIVHGDDIGPRAEFIEAAVEPTADAADVTDQTPKPVGKAAADGSNTAKGSGAGKYVLAAVAIAVGITALILVSRNDGHHHHHHH